MGDEELGNTKRVNENEESEPGEIGIAPPLTAPATEPAQEPPREEPAELLPVETPITQTTQELPEETPVTIPEGSAPVETAPVEAVQEPTGEGEVPQETEPAEASPEPTASEALQGPTEEGEVSQETEPAVASPEPTASEALQGPTEEGEAEPTETPPEEPAGVPEDQPAGKTTDLSMIRAALAAAAKGERMKNIAKDLITTTRTIFGRVKGYGLDLEEEKELFKKAILAIKSEEYIKGAQLTNNVKKMLETAEEKYFFENASISLAGVGDLINQARDVGIDVSILDDPFNKYKISLDKKEFEKIEDFVIQVKEFSKQAALVLNPQIENRLAEVIDNELSTLPAIMERARSLNADISEEVSGLEVVEGLRKEDRRKEAYGNLMELKNSLGAKINQQLKDKYTLQLEDADSSMVSLKTLTGKEFPELQEQIENIKLLLAENNFETIDSLLGEFTLGTENERNSFLFEKYSLQANEMEGDIAVIKEIGIEIGPGEELLANINENIVANDFGKVEEFVPRLSELIDNAKSVEARRLASKLLAATKGLYNTLNSAGVGLGKAKDTFKQGILSIKSQNFVKGCQTLLGTKEILQEINKKYLGEVLATDIDTAFQFYTGFEKIDYFADSHKEEVIPATSEPPVEAVEEPAPSEPVEEPPAPVGQVPEEVIPATSEPPVEAVEEPTEEPAPSQPTEAGATGESSPVEPSGAGPAEEPTATEPSEAEVVEEHPPDVGSEEGEDTTPSPVSILAAYDPGKKDISAIRAALAAAAKGERMKKIAKDLITATKVIFARVKEYGLDLGEEKDMFKKAILAIKSEEYVNGSKITTQLKKRLEAREENYFIDAAQGLLMEVRELMEECKGVELNVQAVEEALKGYEGQLASRDYGKVEEFVGLLREYNRAAVSEMNVQISTKITEIIPLELGQTTEIIEKARSLEADVGPEEERFSTVEGLRSEGKNREAYGVIKDVKRALNGKIAERLTNIYSAQLKEHEDLLASLEEESQKSFSEIREQVDRARGYVGEGNLDAVAPLLEEIRLARESARNAYLFEKHSLKAREFEEDIARLKELGIDMTEADGLLNTLNEYIVGSEFQSVDDMVTRIDGIVINAKTVEARRMASGLLATTKQLYNRLNEANVEMGEAKNTFKEGILAIKSQDYVAGCGVLQRTKAILDEINGNYLSEILTSSLNTAFKYYEEFQNIEYFADTHKEEVKRTLEEAKALLESGDLPQAQEKMNAYGEMEEEINLRKQRYQEATDLSAKLNEVRSFAEELGIAMEEEATLLMEAEERMADFMFDEAISSFEQADAGLNAKIQTKLGENAEGKLQEATTLFQDFREHFTEPERVTELLERAKQLIEANDYNGSIDTAEEVLRLVNMGQEEKLIEDINGVFNEFIATVDECENLGIDVLQPQAQLFKAKTAFERKEYETAYDLGKDALSKALDAKREYHRQQAKEANGKMTEMLQEAESHSIDYSGILEMMNLSKKLFKEEQYVEAKEMADKVMEPLEHLLNEKLKEIIAREIGDLRGIMEEAKGLKVDISGEKERLRNVSSLKEEERYHDAIELIKSIKEAVKSDITGDFQERAAMKREEIEKSCTMMEAEGCLLEDARKKLEEAASMIDEDRFEESLSVLSEAEGMGAQTWEGFQQDRCQNLIKDVSDLLSEIVEVTGGKVDLVPPTELLDQATMTIQSKDFEKAKSLAQEAHSQADRLYYHYVIDSLLGTHDLLLEVKNLGANVTRAQDIFTTAKASLEKKEYTRAIEQSNSAMETIKESRLDFMREEIEKNLKVVTSIATKLKVKDVDVKELEDIRDRVQGRMDENDVEDAFEISKEARALSASFRDDFKKNTIDSILTECNDLIQKLDNFEVDSGDIRVKLDPIVELLDNKKFPEALKSVKESHGVLKQRYNDHYRHVLTEAIEETRAFLGEISETVDITKPAAILGEAEEALGKNDFADCEELNNKARSVAEKSRHSSLVIEAANVLAYAGETIREGEMDGMEVMELNARLMEASEAFEDREYQTVIEVCATIGAAVDKYKSDKLSNIAKEAVRSAKTIIEAAKTIKADVKKPTEKYKMAMNAYKEGHYRDSLDLANETQEIARFQKDLKATTSIVDFVRTSVDNMGGNGVDITEAGEQLSSLGGVIEAGEFEKARSIARNSVKSAMSQNILHDVSDGIERSREYISFALDSDIFLKDYFQTLITGEEEEGKCSECGKDVPENAMFCLWCGNRLQ